MTKPRPQLDLVQAIVGKPSRGQEKTQSLWESENEASYVQKSSCTGGLG
jgi:hypothetical protein